MSAAVILSSSVMAGSLNGCRLSGCHRRYVHIGSPYWTALSRPTACLLRTRSATLRLSANSVRDYALRLALVVSRRSHWKRIAPLLLCRHMDGQIDWGTGLAQVTGACEIATPAKACPSAAPKGNRRAGRYVCVHQRRFAPLPSNVNRRPVRACRPCEASGDFGRGRAAK
jgi:hypothetical protein